MTDPATQIKQLDYTIDLLSVHRQSPQDFPFLLESVAKNDKIGRYDILFAFPQATLWCDSNGKICSDNISFNEQTISEAFSSWFQQTQQAVESALPFSGGWFVYLAYEFAGQVEPTLNLPRDDANLLPIAYFSRVPAAIIVDHQLQKTFIVTETKYQHLMERLEQTIAESHVKSSADSIEVDIIEENPEQYISGVNAIKRYILDGDVFQVNLSRLWQAHLRQSTSAAAVYQRLRIANPAPFAGLALIHDSAVISSSPERLVCVKNGIVETRPIAGTRPRVHSDDMQQDNQTNLKLQEELIAHPKERAEHVMLIDLERNDLGRVCLPGTIEVNELMGLESYEHVHHIVSNIRGHLKPNIDPMSVLKAVFPGGTITGCPKVRCMEIIAELENSPRMAYTGSMGYINRNGSLDLNILIRTIIHHKDQLLIRAGAGIVADSDPENELQETRHKAKGMLNAL